MEISDSELRELVRDAIVRRTAPAAASVSAEPLFVERHSSHARFLIAPTEDGQCVIEPGVRCNHCGYCQSYGH